MIKTQIAPALVLTLACTLFTGGVFPVFTWGVAQLLFPFQAGGSMVERDGVTVGSLLIGQQFSSPKYFHGRPSAAGAGYDPLGSSGTNLGPTSSKLFSGIQDDGSTAEVDESYIGVEGLAIAYRVENGLDTRAPVPVDAVTRSSSGLDPHISVQNARVQSERVAKERALGRDVVNGIIDRNIDRRFLGIFGEPRVNVLQLNLALDSQSSG